jgi:hypothetical protein
MMLRPGIDGMMWETYGENLEGKLKDMHTSRRSAIEPARPEPHGQCA